MIRVLSRRCARLGAGALLSVMLLLAAAAGALGVYYAERADAEARAVDREAGRVFALWFEAAHRASQQHQATFRNSCQPGSGGFEVTAQLLTVAGLRGLGVVPPGLPETAGRGATFTVGIIDDGRGTPCAGRGPEEDGEDVPMAFGVLEPEAWAHSASLREGALEGGLAQIEDITGSGTEMHAHVAKIGTALGRAPASDALFVTADRGVRYRENVIYRRAQPGQRRLNRMETVLDAGGEDVVDAGALAADELMVTADGTVGGSGTVARRTESASLQSATLDAVEVTGDSGLAVSAHLVVGSAVSDGVTTTDMDVTGHAQAQTVDATTMTAQDATVATATGVTGTSTVGTLSGSTVTVRSQLGTATATLAGLYGPTASIGSLTVGSCAGCFPE